MAIDHKFSNAGASSLGELLTSNGQLVVPKFQRNYSWDKENAEALWSDLMYGFQIGKNLHEYTQDMQYLLGSIVLVRDQNNKYWIIDGQQRLSTITILFCVARDIIRENMEFEPNAIPAGYGKIMEMLENTLMGKRTSWKLTLNDTDKDLFKQIQEYEDDPKPQIQRIKQMTIKTKSGKLLRDNYMLLYDKLMESLYTNFDESITPRNIQSMSDEEKKKLVCENIGMLNFFLTHVRENNFVVKIVVSDDITAYQIFETLNTRGQELSKSDLIKNHILSLVKDTGDQRDLSNKWNEVLDSITTQDQRDDEFIMESLRSRCPYLEQTMPPELKQKISPKLLYKIIKNMVGNGSDCVQYIKGLEKDAEFLITLNDPQFYSDDVTRDDIRAIKALKAKFIRIPILAAYRKWGMNKDYRYLVGFLVKFFFKIKIVQKIHAGKLENIVLEITNMINDGKSLKDILIVLKAKDDHDDFNYNFKNKFILKPTSDAAKYVLQQITISLGTEFADVKPIDSLTLEHILPKNYGKWNMNNFFKRSKSNKRMDEFVDHLGNLTLLKSAMNAKINNEPFLYKKQSVDANNKVVGYVTSQLEINKHTVCTYNKWTASIIEERGNLFAKYADKIWDLDSKLVK